MNHSDTFSLYSRWFSAYINHFLVLHPDLAENIQIKADHSRKVHHEILGLAKNIKLTEGDTFIAETIGLFHDIGRFKQYVKYQTFSDSKSQNHAELGVDVLKENNVLKNLTPEQQEIIYKSILNHSRAEIAPDTNEKVISFSKMIRDADKLDIWRLITEYYMVKEQNENKTLELELPDNEEISDEVLQAILNHQLILKESLKTLNDFKLLQIAWIFDLNFDYSIQRLFEKKYLEKIIRTLPQNNKVNKVKTLVDSYFREHIKTFAQ
ncbi:MAG: HD domain-containing protein [Bacteroidales bacterium]